MLATQRQTFHAVPGSPVVYIHTQPALSMNRSSINADISILPHTVTYSGSTRFRVVGLSIGRLPHDVGTEIFGAWVLDPTWDAGPTISTLGLEVDDEVS